MNRELLYRTACIEISDRMLIISRVLCRPPTPICRMSQSRKDVFALQKIQAKSSACFGLNKRYRHFARHPTGVKDTRRARVFTPLLGKVLIFLGGGRH